MNQVTLHNPLTRRVLLSATLVFSVAYMCAAAWLSSAEGLHSEANGTNVSTAGALDVPPGMEQQLAKKIGAVVPQLDELFVFPAADNNGFTVSMTVDFIGDQAPSKQQIKQDMNEIFPAAYSSGQPVEDVEVYFSFNGEIMAGAEMGDSAYHTLASATSSDGSLADALSHAKVVTTEGPNTSWMEVDQSPVGN